jgi:hypothetical protein
VSRRPRDPDVPKVRRCAYCTAKTTVTVAEARESAPLSRPVHSPVWGLAFPPICHETSTTYARSRALISGGTR